MPPLPSASDVKTYLGLTGSGDDALIASLIPVGVAQAERDTGRTFSAASNTTRTYTTNNEAIIGIHDRPVTDASRVVTWNGAALVENTNVWFLPDRRDPSTSTSVQIRAFLGGPEAYKADPMWWDKNLDVLWGRGSMPNDLTITGIIGNPFPPADVTGAILILDAWLYWRAKAGATGTAYTLTGEPVDLAQLPPEYLAFVRDWRIRTAVSSVG
jgi:hypothetical protein